MNKPIIAVDLDDTLAASIDGTLQHVSKILGIKMTRGNIADINYWAQYGVDDSEAIRLVQDYNIQGFPGLQPLPGAVETIARLRESYRIYVVTARDPQVQQITEEWLASHFPHAFEGLLLVGNPYISKIIKPKEAVRKELGATWLIDDSRTHAVAAAEQGIDSILFGGHDWHAEVDAQPHLFVAANWQAAERVLNGKA